MTRNGDITEDNPHFVKRVLISHMFPTNASRLLISCVDPAYPVDSMDSKLNTGICYDGKHVLLAPQYAPRLCLVYNKDRNRFVEINPEQVNENLPNGVVQLSATTGGVIIMGIPGDVYAWNPVAEGFGFGNPKAAPHYLAEKVVKGILGHISTRPANLEVLAMSHPDCGCVAHNIVAAIGADPWLDEVRVTLDQAGSDYMASGYRSIEANRKEGGAIRLIQYLASLNMEINSDNI